MRTTAQAWRFLLICYTSTLGDSNRQIAEQLGIGQGTVRSHVHVLLQKLDTGAWVLGIGLLSHAAREDGGLDPQGPAKFVAADA